MPPYPFETVQELELNAWPDLLGFYRNGWRIRLAGGFTGRANSTTALVRGADLSESELDDVEAIYARHRQTALVRITELVGSDLEKRLDARGYQIQNPSEFRAVALGAQIETDRSVEIMNRASVDWIADFGRLNGRGDFKADTMAAMLSHILLPVGFARLVEDGVVRAVGMGVVDRGLMEVQSIAVDATCRGRGLGRRLVASLLAWGRAAGARDAILSVAANNDPAIRLYTGLGFQKFGEYHYRAKALQV